jgi:uncharacterized protein YbaP (TraB family)
MRHLGLTGLGWLRALLLALTAAAGPAAAATDAPAAAPARAAPAESAASVAAPQAPVACPPPIDRREPALAADRGMLWRIARDGRSSYLFATLHVGRPAWRAFGPRTESALRETDTLALEIDPGDPTLVASLARPPATPVLSPSLQQRLARAAVGACLPPAALAPLHPVLQVVTLTMLDARWLGLDPAYSMEALLAGRARADARRVVALESITMQQTLLVPSDPAAAQALVEQGLAQLEERTSRRVLAQLAGAWERGDLGTLQRYEAWCDCAATVEDRAFLKRMNDDRNPALADAIAELHQRGARVFAAVGALHMTGPQALPALLAARGFHVERVAFGPGP